MFKNASQKWFSRNETRVRNFWLRRPHGHQLLQNTQFHCSFSNLGTSGARTWGTVVLWILNFGAKLHTFFSKTFLSATGLEHAVFWLGGLHLLHQATSLQSSCRKHNFITFLEHWCFRRSDMKKMSFLKSQPSREVAQIFLQKFISRDKTRTRNLLLRKQTPSPLSHEATRWRRKQQLIYFWKTASSDS